MESVIMYKIQTLIKSNWKEILLFAFAVWVNDRLSTIEDHAYNADDYAHRAYNAAYSADDYARRAASSADSAESYARRCAD